MGSCRTPASASRACPKTSASRSTAASGDTTQPGRSLKSSPTVLQTPGGLDFDDYGEAFITNCVIPHLYRVVRGAHFVRMYGMDFNPHAYTLMTTCADHVHWDTAENWGDIRKLGVTPTTDRAGGGHAHVG